MSLHMRMVTFVLPWYLSTKTILQISILSIFPKWHRSSVCAQHEESPGSPRISKPFQLKTLCTYQIMTSSSLQTHQSQVRLTTAKFRFMNFTRKILAHFIVTCDAYIQKKLLKGPHHKEHYWESLQNYWRVLGASSARHQLRIWKTVNQCI